MIKTLALLLLSAYAQAALALHVGPTPIEVFQRPLFKSAPLVRTGSHAAQYAGRTSLGSGQTSVTVSTAAVNSDSLIYHTVRCSLPAAYSVQGILTLNASIAAATASTTAIYSGMHVTLSPGASANVASGQGRGFSVRSVVDGVSFAVAAEDGLSPTSGTWSIGWRIPEAVPAGLHVSTIGVGNFTFAWSDGRGRPVDSTIMWELRRST